MVILISGTACAAGGVTDVTAPVNGTQAAAASGSVPTAGAPTADATTVAEAVNSGVNFADWGIKGGFSAIPLTTLLSLHPQLSGYQQAFTSAAAQASPIIPPQLLVAICLQESSGGLDDGSYGGPFQFTDDGAWNTYGPKGGDRNNMNDAAIGAANYMAALLQENGDDLNAALRSYNGPINQGGLPQYQADIENWMQGKLVYGDGV